VVAAISVDTAESSVAEEATVLAFPFIEIIML
jgi:hypothetical protein